MSRTAVLTGIVALCLLVVVVCPALAQPGGGGGGQRTPMFNLDASWGALTFELKIVDADKWKILRDFYQTQYDKRKEAMAKAREANDFQSVRPVMEQMQLDVEAKLKEVLSEEEMAKYLEWKTTQANMPRGGRGGGGGG
jgi:hypothetical protein